MKSTKIKTILISIVVCAGIFFLSACTKLCVDQVKKPANVPAVDWEVYNDVYTVFWNYYTFCSRTKEEDRGKEIMIYGWVRYITSAKRFTLYEEHRVNSEDHSCPSVEILTRDDNVKKELQAILDTCDLKKKCFIKGRLGFNCLQTISICDTSVPEILLENIDNINFE